MESLTACSRTGSRPIRWSMIAAGTFPLRKPGMVICWAIALYAASRLGLSSSKGTSTVSLTLVGFKVSTALFTVLRSWGSGTVGHGTPTSEGVVGATGLEPAISCSQSRRASHYATPRSDRASLMDDLDGC